ALGAVKSTHLQALGKGSVLGALSDAPAVCASQIVGILAGSPNEFHTVNPLEDSFAVYIRRSANSMAAVAAPGVLSKTATPMLKLTPHCCRRVTARSLCCSLSTTNNASVRPVSGRITANSSPP